MLADYDLKKGWSGYMYYQSDGTLVMKLERNRGGSLTIKAWLDGNGNLHVDTY